MRVLRKIVGALFSNAAGTAVARRMLPALDRLFLALSRGRVTFTGFVEPTIVLETVGARSGQTRQNPLLYVRDGERFVVAGTNFGQASHPAWSGNLLAGPDAVVIHRGRRVPVRAEPITDDSERSRLWKQLDAIYIGFRRYREVTADIREVRMFALVPREAARR